MILGSFLYQPLALRTTVPEADKAPKKEREEKYHYTPRHKEESKDKAVATKRRK